jgi:glycerol uptake facilitator-like aquaporin
MLGYVVEFLGTFLFLSVFISTGQPIFIALALFLMMLLGQNISGAHFNPAISTMFWLKGALTNATFGGYIAAQLLGALGALFVFNALGRA